MKFTIHRHSPNWYDWEASSVKEGVVVKSPGLYKTEKEARSAVALARKAMAGYRRARVEVVDATDEA